MSIALYLDDDSLGHRTPEGHPERPARFEAAKRRLDEPDFAGLPRIAPAPAERDALERAHSARYVDFVLGAERPDALVMLDADTAVGPGSTIAALKAAGAGIDAVDGAMKGTATRGFCLVRPPGHHAEIERPMGFCLFNSIAVAALHATAAHGLERVAVLDFDVHHGNGSQAIFWENPDVLFASSHQMPLFPGTGAEDETGVGNIWNAPLRPGDGGPALRAAWEKRLLPAVDAFKPELILVSAGFDAHRRDPLAQIEAEASDFGWLTARIVELANAHADGRIVAMLEGGYDLTGLMESVAAHVAELGEGL